MTAAENPSSEKEATEFSYMQRSSRFLLPSPLDQRAWPYALELHIEVQSPVGLELIPAAEESQARHARSILEGSRHDSRAKD
ncbi:hypothetical protein J7T55_000982 [Diaporthe amygdali]|uniref:uncharacterized protein n=1 Tax=Phomopsis amygdali TaxID=1214568 RepID=UPI0022FEA051|nr:uncharacterized protein J7T55_000982 [Diaporthe amygdali]KAJ0120127.1 hypothetical protein J7T55_000982 [Diaporthe amygdali]